MIINYFFRTPIILNKKEKKEFGGLDQYPTKQSRRQ